MARKHIPTDTPNRIKLKEGLDRVNDNFTELYNDKLDKGSYTGTAQDLKDLIDAVEGGFQGNIAIADTPTQSGVYFPTEEGAYANAGGLTYNPSTTDSGYLVMFTYNGTDWSKNKVFLGGSVTETQLEEVKMVISKNNALKTNFVIGALNFGGGFDISNTKRIRNNIGIDVVENETYQLRYDFFKVMGIHFYNGNSYISGTTFTGNEFTVPAGANNVKFQFTNQDSNIDINPNDIDKLNLYVGDLNNYLDLGRNSALVEEIDVNGDYDFWRSKMIYGGASASDTNGLTQDKKYISNKDSFELDSGKYTIKLDNPDGLIKYGVYVVDLNGNLIPIGSPPDNLDGYTFEINEPFTIRIPFQKPDNSIITEEEKNNFKIKLYKEGVKYNYWGVVNSVEDYQKNKREFQINNRRTKLLTVIGDSISHGFIPRNDPNYPGDLNSYAKLTADNLGMKYQNLATSGMAMSQLVSKVPQAGIMADVVVVMAGTNDIRAYNVLGSFGDTTTSSFYGSCYQMAYQLLNKYRHNTDDSSRTQIIFCSPIKLGIDIEATYGTNKMSDYAKAVKETAEYFSIPFLDMYNLSGINPHLFRTLQGTEPGYTDMYNPLIPDGVHPNQKGQEIMSKVLTGFIKSIG